MAGASAEGRHHLARDAHSPAGVHLQLLHLHGGQHTRSRGEGSGHRAQIHRLLGAASAAREALAAAATATDVALDRLARIVEGVARVAEEQVAGALDVVRGRCDAEQLGDGVEVGLEVGAARRLQLEAAAPALEHELRRPHTDRRVHEGAAAEGDRLQGRHHVAAGGPQPALAHRPRHGASTVLDEVVRRERGAFFEHHHPYASSGQLVGDDRATRARAHHHYVRLFGEVAQVLRKDAYLAVRARAAHAGGSAEAGAPDSPRRGTGFAAGVRSARV